MLKTDIEKSLDKLGESIIKMGEEIDKEIEILKSKGEGKDKQLKDYRELITVLQDTIEEQEAKLQKATKFIKGVTNMDCTNPGRTMLKAEELLEEITEKKEDSK